MKTHHASPRSSQRLPRLLALLVSCLAVMSSAHAQTVPQFVNYQGHVTDSAGVGIGSPTAANRKVVFRFFDEAAAGTLVWSEQQTVTFVDGDFSVLIGQGIAVAAEPHGSIASIFTGASTNRYLSITVDNGDGTIDANDKEITPRQQMTSTGFAFRSALAETITARTGSANSFTGATVTGGTFTGGSFTGSVTSTGASLTNGNFSGGTFTGGSFSTGSFSGSFSGPLTGNVTGNVTGDLIGNAATANAASIATRAVNADNVTGIVAVANGGTGSSTKNFVDLTTAQTMAGNKRFTGSVAIGAGTGQAGVLDVRGSIASAATLNYSFVGAPNGWGSSNAFAISIYAEQDIWAGRYVLYGSDERIKNIIGRSNGETDLETLIGIQITDYLYKDLVAKGDTPQKKVIAQQLEKVFPQAVSQRTEPVPDIYQNAEIKDNWVILATDLKKGDRVKLITKAGEASLHKVLEVTPSAFRTDFISDEKGVFVYGREVNDFRTVDYEAISMLNVSATQQLKKEKDAEVKALQAQNTALKTRIADLEAKEKARDAKLAAIERMLESASKPVARTASLKTTASAE